MKFPPINGNVKFVDVKHYDHLVDSYVEKISQFQGVLGVVKFGSVSTPGLSDIDLVVTVTDNGPWPDWEDLSLRKHAEGHPAESVVAHDVFVWPERVAKNAEAFFYVDQQTVMYGNKLGGAISSEMKPKLEALITMDYMIHRFESLTSLLTASQISLRQLLLFISTLRHSCNLAAELNLMDDSEKQKIIEDITGLRLSAVSGDLVVSSLDSWPERIIELLWRLTSTLGATDGGKTHSDRPSQWQSGARQIFVSTKSENGVDVWKKSVALQSNRWATRYARMTPLPEVCYDHVCNYLQLESYTSTYLSHNFPSVYLGQSSLLPCVARQLRVETVIRHWNFIEASGYKSSSGIGYLGISRPATGIKNYLLSHFSRINAFALGNL